MEKETSYLSRSWAMLTAEKGWIKPVLVFAAVCCVPVVGQILGSIALIGYGLEWARLTAWGVDSVPKQRGIKVGELLSSGWRGFCVILLLSLAGQFVLSVVQRLLRMLGLGALGSLLEIVLVLVAAFAIIASLRSAIYQKFSAGFGINQLWEMVRRDATGFLKIAGIRLVGVLCVGAVGGAFSIVLLASRADALFGLLEPLIDGIAYDYLSEYEIVEFIMGFFDLFASLTPAFVVASFICMGISTVFNLLVYNAAGLWMRQFNVPAWGSPSDPLPASADAAGAGN